MNKHLKHNNLIARWMDGRLNKEEKEQMEKSGDLEALKVVLDDIDTWKVPAYNVEKKLEDLKKRNSKLIPLKRQKNNSWMRIAASIALLLSFGLAWYTIANGVTIASTKIAEKKTITLPKGSFIELDAASKITYNKKDWKSKRSLSLEGQAFFDVTSGAPFIVNTSTATVSVLGTQFNIKTEKEQFSVHCFEGKIEVSYQNKTEIITMGQSIFLENGKLIKIEHKKKSPEWMTGFSTYNKTPLIDVVADIQRYYQVDMVLPKKYESLQFTGTMEHTDLKHCLNTIFTTMEIKFTLENNNKVIFD